MKHIAMIYNQNIMLKNCKQLAEETTVDWPAVGSEALNLANMEAHKRQVRVL